ncbi:MAG: 8-amino-7-oxononanoate synthase [Chlamydiota bacterium]
MTAASPLSEQLLRELDLIRAAGLYREPRLVDGAQGPRVVVGGREYLCFCANNYLGLAEHPAVAEAAREAIGRYGWGSGASRLISGTMRLHDELERELAAFKGREAAIAFSSGYAANLGVLGALAGPGDTLVIDKLDHASIVDGCRLSGAAVRVYPHGDTAKLERILAVSAASRRRIVVTDSLFSMDGDLAPLDRIAGLARRYGACLMVDEAHATGVLGERGRGGAELLGVEDAVDVSMGTLSKALGGSGGFVAGSAALIDYLRHRARSFVYTTAPPPAACAAALAALKIVRARPSLRRVVLRRAERLRKGLAGLGFDTMGSAFQIVPVRVGEAGAAARLSRELLARGILAPAIRPPTVPKGSSRLRLSVMASHTDEDIDRLLDAFRSIGGGTP